MRRGCLSFWQWPERGEIGSMKSGRVGRRLSALESVAAVHRVQQDAITVAEWATWRATGVAPERWRRLPAALEFMCLADQRAAAVAEMLAAFEGGDGEQPGSPMP